MHILWAESHGTYCENERMGCVFVSQIRLIDRGLSFPVFSCCCFSEPAALSLSLAVDFSSPFFISLYTTVQLCKSIVALLCSIRQ